MESKPQNRGQTGSRYIYIYIYLQLVGPTVAVPDGSRQFDPHDSPLEVGVKEVNPTVGRMKIRGLE